MVSITSIELRHKLTLYRWNSYHPGMVIQKLVAQAVVAALKGTFF